MAAVATATGAGPAARLIDNLIVDHDGQDAVATALAARRPAWLPALADKLLNSDGWPNHWRVTRGLVRATTIDRPDHPNYTLHMVRGLGTDIHDRLLADPELLNDEVWLFTVEGAGHQLRSHDSWTAQRPDLPAEEDYTWVAALVRLTAEGHLDRGRLLAECLSAFIHG